MIGLVSPRVNAKSLVLSLFVSYSQITVFISPDPRVLFGDVNTNAGSCTEGAPGCKCSWVKPEYKSCNYHIEGMGLISRVHGAGKEVSS
jgi:hypothetical protein